MGDAWLVVGLKGARVGPLVGYLHLVDVDGEVAVVAVGQRDALVQRPLVRPREQDVGAVEPGLVGHLLVNPTSARGTGSRAQVKRKRKKRKKGGMRRVSRSFNVLTPLRYISLDVVSLLQHMDQWMAVMKKMSVE